MAQSIPISGASHNDAARLDAIAVFVQPMDEEHVRAHMLLTLLDDVTGDTAIRLFQQTIFGQPASQARAAGPAGGNPICADKSAIAYRRWLSGKGITYGVIPSAA